MAFNLGAALTSAGEIAPALTSAQEAERERKATIERLGQESAARNIANQRSQFELSQERQKWIPLGITQSVGGVKKQAVLTPDKGIQWIDSDDPVMERRRVFEQLSQDPQIGKTLTALAPDDQAQYFLTGKFPSRPSADTMARADYATDPDPKKGTFEEWKAKQAAAGRVAGAPPRQDAFHEFMSDPASYQKFLEVQAKVRSMFKSGEKAGFGALYTANRMLQEAYNNNPAMIPVAGELLGRVLKQAGVPLSPADEQALVSTPIGQPLSPSTGGAIGLKMPGAPTGATRSQAQVAKRVLDAMPGLRQSVTNAASMLGPAKGRLLIGFLLGKVGSTGDPAVDRQLAGLKTGLAFGGSAAAKFHINSVRQAEMFEGLVGAGKSSAEAIQGFLDTVEKWAHDTYVQELGYGEQGAGATTPPPGAQIIKWEDVK